VQQQGGEQRVLPGRPERQGRPGLVHYRNRPEDPELHAEPPDDNIPIAVSMFDDPASRSRLVRV
jgi:hypothetical protein